MYGLLPYKVLSTPRIANAVVLTLLLACTALTLVYVGLGVVDTLTRDEWHFVDIVRHWYAGQLSWADFWNTNTAGSEHRTPAFRLYFLVNALFFGLNVRLGCWLGVLAVGLFAWLLYRYFLRVRPAAPAAFDHFAFIPVLIVMFSYVQAPIFAYDLLAVFAIVGTMLFAALWMRMDLDLRAPRSAWAYFCFAAALVVLLLLFGAGKGPAIVLATLLMGALLALQAPGGLRASLPMLAWLVGGLLVAELFYWYGGAGEVTGASLRQLAGNALADPAGAAEYVLHALGATSVNPIDISSLESVSRSATLDWVGAGVLIACLAALVIYLVTRMYRRSIVPLALAVFAAAYIGELVIGRFGDGTNNGGAARYVFTTHLLVVASMFVFVDALSGLYAAGRRWPASAGLVLLIAALGTLGVHDALTEFRHLPGLVRTQEGGVSVARQRLAGGTDPYPFWYCPDQELCDQGVHFLAEHRLSLFHDAPAAGAK